MVKKTSQEKLSQEKKAIPKLIFILIILVLADRITKEFFKNKNIVFIKHIIETKYIENQGVIFGIFANSKIVTIILPILIITLLFILLYKNKGYLNKNVTAIAFLISGLLGNLIDRLLYGHVIDFIFIPVIPKYNIFLFNLSDLFLIIGVLLLVKKFNKLQ